jgi:hypothetical protein
MSKNPTPPVMTHIPRLFPDSRRDTRWPYILGLVAALVLHAIFVAGSQRLKAGGPPRQVEITVVRSSSPADTSPAPVAAPAPPPSDQDGARNRQESKEGIRKQNQKPQAAKPQTAPPSADEQPHKSPAPKTRMSGMATLAIGDNEFVLENQETLVELVVSGSILLGLAYDVNGVLVAIYDASCAAGASDGRCVRPTGKKLELFLADKDMLHEDRSVDLVEYDDAALRNLILAKAASRGAQKASLQLALDPQRTLEWSRHVDRPGRYLVSCKRGKQCHTQLIAAREGQAP